MYKFVLSAALAAASFASPVAAATITNFNSTPAGGFTYGSGNNYAPANAVVTTSTDSLGAVSDQQAVRFHVAGQAAAASNAGLYTFALGTQNISFDYSIFGGTNPMLRLTNLLTGATAQYDPTNTAFGNSTNAFGAIQNSEQLGFSFLNSAAIFGNLGFNANVNDTYRLDL